MTQRVRQLLWIAGYSVVAVLTLLVVAVSALRYITTSAEAPDFILANMFANPYLVIHVSGAIIALLFGPLQFLRAIRTKMPRVHRSIGRIYIGACAVGALSGLPLALGTAAGPIAGAGFGISALLWLAFTYLGLRAVIERRFADHREWMIRSYAMTFNGITLRLLIPLSMVLNFEFMPAYVAIAWLNWIINLILFEAYIRRTRVSTRIEGRLATA